MAHTLRFGDEVTLWLDERLPSFVQSEGFVDIRCLLKPSPPPSPHPPSFRGAVFRLRPVASALGAATTTEAFVLDDRGTVRYRGAVDDRLGLGYVRNEPRSTPLVDAVDASVEL